MSTFTDPPSSRCVDEAAGADVATRQTWTPTAGRSRAAKGSPAIPLQCACSSRKLRQLSVALPPVRPASAASASNRSHVAAASPASPVHVARHVQRVNIVGAHRQRQLGDVDSAFVPEGRRAFPVPGFVMGIVSISAATRSIGRAVCRLKRGVSVQPPAMSPGGAPLRQDSEGRRRGCRLDAAGMSATPTQVTRPSGTVAARPWRGRG